MRSLWRHLVTLTRKPRLKVVVSASAVVVLGATLFVVLDSDDDHPVQVTVADETPAFDGVTTTNGTITTTSIVPAVVVPPTTAPGGPVTVTTTEPPSPAPVGTTEFVATGTDHVISADGRFVAYSVLVPNTSPPARVDVHLRDNLTGATELISANSSGGRANGDSRAWGVSQDGRFVAFSSIADDLVPGDTNDESDVFVWDRVTRTVERVSVTTTGAQASGEYAAMSADGRYVVFRSGLQWPDGGNYNQQVSSAIG